MAKIAGRIFMGISSVKNPYHVLPLSVHLMAGNFRANYPSSKVAGDRVMANTSVSQMETDVLAHFERHEGPCLFCWCTEETLAQARRQAMERAKAGEVLVE